MAFPAGSSPSISLPIWLISLLTFRQIPMIPPLALGGDFRNVLGEGEALGEALGGLSLVCSLLHARARAYSHKKMMRYALWGLLMPPEQSKRIPVRR